MTARILFVVPLLVATSASVAEVESSARWIGSAPETADTQSSSRARVIFEVAAKTVRHAEIRVASPCFCEVWLDGEKVDPRRILSPGCTDYALHVNEETYDVTGRISGGRHCLGLWLGPGYSSDFSKQGWRWLKPKCVRAELKVEYADGTRLVVPSGPDWSYLEKSPVVSASIYHGETFDARLEDPTWCQADADGDGWAPAALAEEFPAVVEPTRLPPIRLCDPLRPVAVKRLGERRFAVDFGVNRAGVVAVRATGERGTEIRIRTAEEINADGSLDLRTNRKAANTDVWILAGMGKREEYCPRFTYHGFRYAEIDGYPGELTVEDVTGWAVRASFRENGRFDCSHGGLLKLRDAARRSMESNMLAYPSDCCQRDERTPCIMDVETYMDVACKVFDAKGFFRAYVENIPPKRTIKLPRPEDEVPGAWIPQRCNPDWNGCAIELPWTLWMEYGDLSALAAAYPTMKATAEAFLSAYPDYRCFRGYGDWCPPNDGEPRSFFSEVEFVNSALFVRQLGFVAEAAQALGKAEDAARYARQAAAAKDAFNARHFDTGKGTYGSGRQVTFVLPLAFGLVPEAHRARVGTNLVEAIRRRDGGKLDVGIFGARFFPEVLCDLGEEDLAIDMLTCPDYPSFGFMFASGATTLWEQWAANGRMHSHNHVMFAGATTFFYTRLGGIRPLAPGYARVAVDPVLPRSLDRAFAEIDTPHGRISSSWKRTEGKVELVVTIPAGVEGVSLGEHLVAGENVRIVTEKVDLWK